MISLNVVGKIHKPQRMCNGLQFTKDIPYSTPNINKLKIYRLLYNNICHTQDLVLPLKEIAQEE